jgi:ribosome biogenesis protein BMS1
MFSSAVKIAKFEGASVKTVSVIRGQIKRALNSRKGISGPRLMSDIAFLRAWFTLSGRTSFTTLP